MCPKVEELKSEGCRPFVAPLREIVFYHQWGAAWQDAVPTARLVFAANPMIGWWMPSTGTEPNLCAFGKIS
jgi:hypothetical protein